MTADRVGSARAAEAIAEVRGELVDDAKRAVDVNLSAVFRSQPERRLGDVAARIAGAGEKGLARVHFHRRNDAPPSAPRGATARGIASARC